MFYLSIIVPLEIGMVMLNNFLFAIELQLAHQEEPDTMNLEKNNKEPRKGSVDESACMVGLFLE